MFEIQAKERDISVKRCSFQKNKTKRMGFPGCHTIYDFSVYYLAKKDSQWTIFNVCVEAGQRGIIQLSMHVYNFVYIYFFYRLRFSDQLDLNERQSSKNHPEQQQNHISF